MRPPGSSSPTGTAYGLPKLVDSAGELRERPPCTSAGSRKARPARIRSSGTNCAPYGGSSASGTRSRLSCSRRAGSAVHHGGVCPHGRTCRLRSEARVQSRPAYAEARMRLRPRQHRPRHQGTSSLPRAPQYPAHGALLRIGTDAVQGFLAALTGRSHPTVITRRAEGFRAAVPTVGLFGTPTLAARIGITAVLHTWAQLEQ
jgi:hypothetical protein